MIELIQVCRDINAKVLKQKTHVLKEAMKHFDLKELLVITSDYSSTENFDDRVIKFVLLYQWLIEVKNE